MKEERIDDLVEALDAEFFKIRQQAVTQLLKIGTREGIHPIFVQMSRRFEETLDVLKANKDLIPMTILLEMAENDEDRDIRTRVSFVLETIGDESCLPVLMNWLANKPSLAYHAGVIIHRLGGATLDSIGNIISDRKKNNVCRLGAIAALQKSRDPEVIEILSNVAREEAEGLGKSAMYALKQIGGSEAIGVLRDLLEHENPEFQMSAAAVLRDGDTLLNLFDKYPDKRCNILRVMVEALDDPYDQRLIDCFFTSQKDLDLRLTATINLKNIFGQEKLANEYLIPTLKDKKESVEARVAAAYALGIVGGDNQLSVLNKLLNPPNSSKNPLKVQLEIRRAIKKIHKRLYPTKKERRELSEMVGSLISVFDESL